MPIKRHFLGEDDESPIIFHVTEEFEVYDGNAALVIDHLLNHLKALVGVADGMVDQSLVDILSKYPHYKIDSDGYYSEGATQESVTKTVMDECVVLIDCLTKIVSAHEDEQRSKLLKTMRAKVPFLDYRYSEDTFPSDAEHDD